MKNKILLPLGLLLLPFVASAAFAGITDFVGSAGAIITNLTKVAAAAALLVFFWGLVKFIMKAGDEAAVEEGRRLMIWGLVALFVMVSVWGLTAWIGVQLNIGTGDTPAIPTFPGSTSGSTSVPPGTGGIRI